MTKRQVSIDALAGQMKQLDTQRKKLADEIRQATEKLLSGENPFPWSKAPGRRGRKAGRTAGRRKGFKMSAAARKRISAAQKARWAKVKKTKPA